MSQEFFIFETLFSLSPSSNLLFHFLQEEDGEGRKSKINYEDDDDDESDDESVSSIASYNDDSRKGSGDESLNSSQQPMLRLSAMSHISGICI